LLSTTFQSDSGIKLKPTDPFANNSSATSVASVAANAIKPEPSKDLLPKQDPKGSTTQPIAATVTMNGNGITTSLGSSPPVAPLANSLTTLTAAASTPVVPMQPTVAMPQMPPVVQQQQQQQIPTLFSPSRQRVQVQVQAPPAVGTSMSSKNNAPTTMAAVGAAPGTVRSGNGGGVSLIIL
jgi:hypothetical protein